MIEIALRIAVVGLVATLVMDAWGLILRRVFGIAGLDYRLVGRWIGHMPRGRFIHDAIARSAPIAAELPLGWIAHYAIGIIFAAGFIALAGTGWLAAPSLYPALLAGLVTVAAPLFVLQPALGLGVAASRSPRPNAARLRSLITHLVFGIGLYAAGALSAMLCNQIPQP